MSDALTQLLTKLDKQRALKVGDWWAKMPPLAPDNNAPNVSREQLGQFLRRVIEKGKDLDTVDVVRAGTTEVSRDKLGVALVRNWYARKAPIKDKYVVFAAGHLGGVATAALLLEKVYKELDTSSGHHRCLALALALKHLAERGTGDARAVAVCGLDLLRTVPSNYRARRLHARELLSDLCGAPDDQSLARMLAREVPRDTGKAEGRLRVLLERRLERWMIDGVRLEGLDFEESVVDHPVVSGIARLLVWAVFDNGKARAFRIDEVGLFDLEDRRVDLDPSALIGVVHPLELDDDVRPAWKELAQKRELAAPFPQMKRKTFALKSTENGQQLTRYKGLYYTRLEGPARDAGFFASAEGDMGGTEGFEAHFARGDQWISLFLPFGTYEYAVPGKIDWRGNILGTMRWPEVDPVVVSEVLYALDRAGGREESRGKRAAGIAAKGGASVTSGGGYPYAEFAKSGRSKCVVCAEKIEKGAVRVAIEREIDAGTFTKKGPVFLHIACMDGVPELQIDDLDERLRRNSDGVWPPS